MSSKEMAVELIKKLPKEATLTDIALEIEFLAGLQRGTQGWTEGKE